jgi:hypothetical protein
MGFSEKSRYSSGTPERWKLRTWVMATMLVMGSAQEAGTAPDNKVTPKKQPNQVSSHLDLDSVISFRERLPDWLKNQFTAKKAIG